MHDIEKQIVPFLHDPILAEKYQSITRLMDLFYQLEDIRDHMNEVMDYLSRIGGVGGTGAYAPAPIENLDENCDAFCKKYEELKEKYPEFLPQIESVLGVGLALLRQKKKFRWSTMHEYNF